MQSLCQEFLGTTFESIFRGNNCHDKWEIGAVEYIDAKETKEKTFHFILISFLVALFHSEYIYFHIINILEILAGRAE